jgi:serine protease AprX
VIVMLKPGWDADAESKRLGGKLGRRLESINGKVVELTNNQLKKLADYPGVDRIVYDRPTAGEMNRVAVTVGARAVQQLYGYRGAGIGIAVIDSGVARHDDLTYLGSSSLVKTKNGQRVAAFVDFVNGRTSPYDDNGHGTHVAGIIAGNGYDSLGVRAGIAPDAHLVSLKVLDQNGRGVISDVISALDWTVANKAAYNIRVINLSVGAGVTESYKTDPLTLAAKRAVDAGIVVVTAAGNLGKNAQGRTQYGAIGSPGNAPWVITVGAYSHEGTVERNDDVIAGFSSRGPTAFDYEAKPDIVAPGVGTVSLSDPGGLMYLTKPTALLSGALGGLLGGGLLGGGLPYFSLSGTSMASPVVAGSVALMLQANPSLTPNLVKAILEYTAQEYRGYDSLTQGAGFLNTKGAVDLARFFKSAKAGQTYPHPAEWSKKLNWGNHRISHGVIKPNATAWKSGVLWGASKTVTGQNIVWGTACGSHCNNVVWSSMDNEDNIVWGTASADEDNIVWGTFAALDEDNIVWGTMSDDEDNIVWGTNCGGANCSNAVWGTAAMNEDNIVWGTSTVTGLNVVWGTSGDMDNTVWGTSASEDNITWGTSDASSDDTPFDDPLAPPVSFDSSVYDSLFGPVTLDPAAASPTSTTTTVLGGIGGVL